MSVERHLMSAYTPGLDFMKLCINDAMLLSGLYLAGLFQISVLHSIYLEGVFEHINKPLPQVSNC